MPREPTKPETRQNALLAAAPSAERELISEALERVPLSFKEVLQEIDTPLSHLWFPISGVVSVVTELESGDIVENATIGHEGFVGLSEILGAHSTTQRTLVQIPGEADRLPVKTFARMRDRLPGLEKLQMHYALSLISQIAQGSACNRIHPVEQRCARWLLQTHDRVDGDSFSLTHEFLAQMLGVTRPSVTIAAGMLANSGLIDYVRGVITILDRAGLEAASCECYRVIKAEFERLRSLK